MHHLFRFTFWLAVAACLVVGLSGCAATAHTMNLPTLDDFKEHAKDEASTDRDMAALTVAYVEGAIDKETFAVETEKAIKKGEDNFAIRIATPGKGGKTDWGTIAGSVAGAVAIAVLSYFGIKIPAKAAAKQEVAKVDAQRTVSRERAMATVHDRIKSVEESIGATDRALEHVEAKVDVVLPAAVAPRGANG